MQARVYQDAYSEFQLDMRVGVAADRRKVLAGQSKEDGPRKSQ
jgi:hypothetical protein